ncbi:MAG: sialidase family protein [Actinomycetota bacterium]
MKAKGFIAGAIAAAFVSGALATGVQASPIASGTEQVALTSGAKYDRNPVILEDGTTTDQFFARSQDDCDRIAGCSADNSNYDLYYMTSADRGRTWSEPVLMAVNPGPGSSAFRGRTISATRTDDGTVWVFWTSGGNGSDIHYFEKPAGQPFPSAPTGTLSGNFYYNAEVVSKGNTIFMYAEDSSDGNTYVQTFDGTTFSPRQVALSNASIPKVIVDNKGVFRMASVTAYTWPDVDVRVASSTDGITWGAPQVVVDGDGTITNWDASLAQGADKSYHVVWAPDQNDGSQRIETISSKDFSTWSNRQVLTTGTDGTNNYWEYWPEAAALQGNFLQVYFTSERPTMDDPNGGTAHIYRMEIKA